MRRIYESRALHRDDDDPFSPRETKAKRSHVNWRALSHAVVPMWLRYRAIEVSLETNEDVYRTGETVFFRVTFRNRFSVPISLRTPTPVRWQWAVDGIPEASRHDEYDAPDRPTLFEFDRRERKVYERRWTQKIRHDRDRWERIEPGRHELSVRIGGDRPIGKGLSAKRTIRIR